MSEAGIDPYLWARCPQSQNTVDAVFHNARSCDVFAGIRDRLIASGVCSAEGQIALVWSFAAGAFVRPAWYVRVNGERAA